MEKLNAPSGGLRWGDNGVPYSVAFNDQYFCKDNGYDEAVHVCCRGNSLQERFSALDPSCPGTFTIMETGFGTGLDFCCARQVWEQCASPSWNLHFVSLELFPLGQEDVARALGLWTALGALGQELAAAYEPSPGLVRDWYFKDRRVRLTIVFDDVLAALGRIKAGGIVPRGADAWFLDGFAPSKNPAMWSQQVFEAMAALSKPGTTLSTFTVAGSVRRGLAGQGFRVRKVPAHGKKNQMLTGVFNPDLMPEK